MKIIDLLIEGLLRSPLHGVLSADTGVIRYVGRRSGREFSTPVRYVEHGEDLLVLVGRPETKTWWRNFTEEHGVDVLVCGQWQAMRARVVDGATDPDVAAPLLDAYLARVPKAAALDGDDRTSRVKAAVLVRCRPVG